MGRLHSPLWRPIGAAAEEETESRRAQCADRADAGHGVPALDVLRLDLSPGAAGGTVRDEPAAPAGRDEDGGGTGGEPGGSFQRVAGGLAHLAHHPEGW